MTDPKVSEKYSQRKGKCALGPAHGTRKFRVRGRTMSMDCASVLFFADQKPFESIRKFPGPFLYGTSHLLGTLLASCAVLCGRVLLLRKYGDAEIRENFTPRDGQKSHIAVTKVFIKRESHTDVGYDKSGRVGGVIFTPSTPHDVHRNVFFLRDSAE